MSQKCVEDFTMTGVSERGSYIDTASKSNKNNVHAHLGSHCFNREPTHRFMYKAFGQG